MPDRRTFTTHALFRELRVTLGFARLRLLEGRQDEAKRMPAPVYSRFTEGMTDLRAARAMLDAIP